MAGIYDISMAGHAVEAFAFTMNLEASVVLADVGAPAAIDATADATVKVAGDGDAIFGRIETVEDRSTQEGGNTGAVNTKCIQRYTYEGVLPVVGEGAVGSATRGTVKSTALAATAGEAVILAVNSTDSTVDVYIR